jgi:hypothetical protein
VLIDFIEMPKKKSNQLIKNGDAFRYLMQMYQLNCYSKTAPYHRRYTTAPTQELIEYHSFEYDSTYEICWTDLIKILKRIDVFFINKILYKEYVQKKLIDKGYSISRLSVDSTIPKGTLDLMFKKIKIELRLEIKKMIDDENTFDIKPIKIK